MPLKKSSRHSAITGRFAEELVLYWLSKYGYECFRVDHVGIDLMAYDEDGKHGKGISVKARSRNEDKENVSVSIGRFDHAVSMCKKFKLEPYYAVVVDGGAHKKPVNRCIRGFVLPLALLEKYAGGPPGGSRQWKMSRMFLKKYDDDPAIMKFTLHVRADTWADAKPCK